MVWQSTEHGAVKVVGPFQVRFCVTTHMHKGLIGAVDTLQLLCWDAALQLLPMCNDRPRYNPSRMGGSTHIWLCA